MVQCSRCRSDGVVDDGGDGGKESAAAEETPVERGGGFPLLLRTLRSG